MPVSGSQRLRAAFDTDKGLAPFGRGNQTDDVDGEATLEHVVKRCQSARQHDGLHFATAHSSQKILVVIGAQPATNDSVS